MLAEYTYIGPVTLKDDKGLSYIDDDEVETAKNLIDAEFVKKTGKPMEYRAAGAFVLCKLYMRPEELSVVEHDDGTTTTLWRPKAHLDSDKYHSVAGLVISIGPDAFQGVDGKGFPRFAKPTCRVGDWVNLPRTSGYAFMYRGFAVCQIYDDLILGVVTDPEDVEPINQKPLI